MRWFVTFVLISVVGVLVYTAFARLPKTNIEAATVIIQNQPGNKILLITLEGTAYLDSNEVPSGYAVETVLDTQGNIVGGWRNVRQLPPGMLESLRNMESSPNRYVINNFYEGEMAKFEAFIAGFRQPPESAPVTVEESNTIFQLQAGSNTDGAVISRPPVSQPLEFGNLTENGLPVSTPPFAVSPANTGE